jgi:hypothetical protein
LKVIHLALWSAVFTFPFIVVFEVYGQTLRRLADLHKILRGALAGLAYLSVCALIVVPMLQWTDIATWVVSLDPEMNDRGDLLFGYVLAAIAGAAYFGFRHMKHLKTKGFF